MMVSGIVPAKDALALGLPLDLAVRSWAECCDEIVVVTMKGDPCIPAMVKLNEELSSCEVKVRSIEGPTTVDLFRFFGYFWTAKPDWVIHFDADYLIAPDEAKKLRAGLEVSDPNVECITYVLIYLNYLGNRMFFTKDMKDWAHPYDGFQGEHPFIVNPRRHIFICPFMGPREIGHYINFEGVMSLNQESWGRGYISKFDKDHPPLNVLRSEIRVEHLLWSMKPECVKEKVDRVPYREWGVRMDDALGGHHPYDVSYPILEEARKRYR